jgi:hypothetical protein
LQAVVNENASGDVMALRLQIQQLKVCVEEAFLCLELQEVT